VQERKVNKPYILLLLTCFHSLNIKKKAGLGGEGGSSVMTQIYFAINEKKYCGHER
jgi:hypothetical protein